MMTNPAVKTWRLLSPTMLFLFLSLLTSCHFNKMAETKHGQGTPEKIIAIPLFSNATFEPILEKELTRIFKSVFYQDGWEVKNHASGDDRTLSGKIIGFTQRPTALTSTGGARAYQIRIDMEVHLLQGLEQKKTFVKNISGISDYVAQPNATADRSAKDRAIREAGEAMAAQLSTLIRVPLQRQPTVTTP